MPINWLKNKYSVKSDFFKDSVTLISGTTISQIVPVAAAPILARIYHPEDYGVLGIYMSVVGLISVISTLAYTNAIMLPASELEANKLVSLCLRLVGLTTLIALVIVLFLSNYISSTFNSPRLKFWILFAPLSLLMNGINGVFSMYASRLKKFKLLSFNRVFCTIGTVITSLIVGLITKSEIGLFMGLFVNQILGSIYLTYQTLKNTSFKTLDFLKYEWKTVARKYINFPKYSLSADFINNFTNQIPIFMLSRYANPASVGYYGMSNRMLGLPSTFISSSIGEVFRQRAAKDYAESGTCRPIFIKTFKTLLLISIVPFAVLMLFGADIFAFIFGEKWRFAGIYTQITGPLFLFKFVVSPLTYVYIITEKQKEDFILHLLFVVLGIATLFIGLKYYNSVTTALGIFVFSYCAIYMIYLIRSYQLSLK